MKLKMYVINEGDLCTDWVVAENEEQAVGIYEDLTGINMYEEHQDSGGNDLEDYIRQMAMDEIMTYYHDGVVPEKSTIQNLIDK